ncbi:hypothetical protein [Flavimaribacter sediminis]|nr:hypothetical protein [Flavimaribacter sediminis]
MLRLNDGTEPETVSGSDIVRSRMAGAWNRKSDDNPVPLDKAA